MPSVAAFLLVLIALFLPARAEAPALELEQGTLPLLIVAGHGGHLGLQGAEQRSKDLVDDPHFVLFGDAKTNDLARDLSGAIAQEYSGEQRPSLLLNWIHRRYADVNRTEQLTSHDPLGKAHHAAYHAAVAAELERLVRRHGWALLLDIHGQARYETSLLLGTGENTLVEAWSLHALWGPRGLVETLKTSGFSVEPETPQGKQRYGGGYTIRHHGAAPRVEAWQMEHSTALRNDQEARAKYLGIVASVLARALRAFPHSPDQTF